MKYCVIDLQYSMTFYFQLNVSIATVTLIMRYGFFVYNTINTHFFINDFLCKYKKLYQKRKKIY